MRQRHSHVDSAISCGMVSCAMMILPLVIGGILMVLAMISPGERQVLWAIGSVVVKVALLCPFVILLLCLIPRR